MALLTVPWMLFLKPYILRKRNKKSLENKNIEEIELADLKNEYKYNEMVEEHDNVRTQIF
jgi:hypothetical protein